jgi:hypothetical protein
MNHSSLVLDTVINRVTKKPEDAYYLLKNIAKINDKAQSLKITGLSSKVKG